MVTKTSSELENSQPQSLTEKIRWRIENDRNPIFPSLLDKLAVRSYAEERGVEVPDLLRVSRFPGKAMFRGMPAEYFLKATHGCGWNFHVKDGVARLHLGRTVDREHAQKAIPLRKVIRLCKSWLRSDFSKQHGEWAYSRIPPRIMAEGIVHQAGGGALVDYKCFTFDGKVALIYAVDDPTRWSNGGSEFRDTQWNRVKLTQCRDPWADPPLAKPENLDEIIAAAETLGKGLDFCRVDLYSTTKGIVLGEITLYPQAGYDTITGCPNFDRWLGDQWPLPGRAVMKTGMKGNGNWI